MKKYLTLIFLLHFTLFSTSASSCDLAKDKINWLLRLSPYNVTKITCSSEHPWTYLYVVKNITTTKKAPKELRLRQDPISRKKKTIKDRKIASIPEQKKIHSLSLGSFYGAASLIATDSSSKIQEKVASDIGFGFSAIWTHHWSEDLHYFFVGSMKKFNFKTSPGRSLKVSSLSQSYVGSGINLKLNDRTTLSSGLGLGQSFLLTSDGTSELNIKKITIPTVSIGINYDLIKFNSGFNLTTHLRVGGLMPTNQNGISTKFGHYQSIGIGSNLGLFGQKLNISTTYMKRSLNSANIEQSSKELGISIGMGWDF